MNKDQELQSRIELIEEMINSTRTNLSGTSFAYLLWGWLVLAASLSHYVLMYIMHYEHPYIAWSLMLVGGIVHFIYSWKYENRSGTKNYSDTALAGVWIAFIISIFLLLLAMYAIGPTNVYPIFIMLYAIAIFATGYIIEFKPFIYGAVSNWIIAAICLFQPFQFQLLLLALAILLSYIIPGYMLRAKFGK